MATMTTTCRKCGAVLPGGTLLAHEKAEHAAPVVAPAARRGYVCRQPKCVEVYGPRGHAPGTEGPHAY